MQKPQPKAELIVIKSPSLKTVIDITYASPDAREWILTNAPEFGSLYESTTGAPAFTLFVFDTYDASQIEAYLRSYNTAEAESR